MSSNITGKELAKIIEKFGFLYSHTTGSHMIYNHPDGRKTKIFHTTIFTLALFNSANKILLYKSMNLFTNGFSVFNL